MRKSVFAGAVAAALVFAGLVPEAAFAAQGLNGAYYRFRTPPVTLAQAEADIVASSNPTATFTANTVCFPSCGASIGDGALLSQFLDAPNATDLSTDFAGLGGHAVVLTGFLNIQTAGLYTFNLGSDDGSELEIDNGLVSSIDKDHPLEFVQKTVSLAAGFHAIRVLEFEDGGLTGLTLLMNNQALAGASIQTEAPSIVPEPASWALMVAGLGVAGFALRRRSAPAAA